MRNSFCECSAKQRKSEIPVLPPAYSVPFPDPPNLTVPMVGWCRAAVGAQLPSLWTGRHGPQNIGKVATMADCMAFWQTLQSTSILYRLQNTNVIFFYSTYSRGKMLPCSTAKAPFISIQASYTNWMGCCCWSYMKTRLDVLKMRPLLVSNYTTQSSKRQNLFYELFLCLSLSFRVQPL